MSNFEKAAFCIDSIPGIHFDGYHDGSDWNGFACPYFEYQKAEQILQASEKNGFNWTYNEQEDAFKVRSSIDPIEYEPEIFQGEMITFQSNQIKVYPIGAYSWIWGVCDE